LQKDADGHSRDVCLKERGREREGERERERAGERAGERLTKCRRRTRPRTTKCVLGGAGTRRAEGLLLAGGLLRTAASARRVAPGGRRGGGGVTCILPAGFAATLLTNVSVKCSRKAQTTCCGRCGDSVARVRPNSRSTLTTCGSSRWTSCAPSWRVCLAWNASSLGAGSTTPTCS